MALLMLHVLWELLLHICMNLVHNTAWGSVAFFLPAARPRLIPRSRKDRRLSSSSVQAVQYSSLSSYERFSSKHPLQDSLYLLRVVSVAGAGRWGTAHHLSNSAKKCFIFITFISMYPVGNDHLNLSPNTPRLQGMHLLIPLYKTSLKRYSFPCKLKPVNEWAHGQCHQ